MKAVFALSLLAVVCVLAEGAQELDIDDPDVKSLARVGAKYVSDDLVDKYHHVLYRINSATSVFENYEPFSIDIIIVRTKCLKSEVSYDDIDECEFAKITNSAVKRCQIYFHERQVMAFACFHVKDYLF